MAARPAPPALQRARTPILAAGVAIALAVASGARADDPFRRYVETHPGIEEEDLLDLTAGDPPDRVLAVLYNPDLDVDPVQVTAFQIDGPTLLEVPLARAVGDAAPGSPERPAFLAVRQRCSTPPEGAGEPVFSSWLLFREGRLRAWSLVPYDASCRPEDPLVEASRHEDMRLVGSVVFRRADVGEFRYGPLQYERWNDAFAAPTPAAMLSRLEAAAAADPADASAQNRLAVGLYALGERARALEVLEVAAARAPTWPLVHRNLAVAHLHRGNLSAARAARERADALESQRRSGVTSPPLDAHSSH